MKPAAKKNLSLKRKFNSELRTVLRNLDVVFGKDKPFDGLCPISRFRLVQLKRNPKVTEHLELKALVELIDSMSMWSVSDCPEAFPAIVACMNGEVMGTNWGRLP